jgi:hypothetical protein
LFPFPARGQRYKFKILCKNGRFYFYFSRKQNCHTVYSFAIVVKVALRSKPNILPL